MLGAFAETSAAAAVLPRHFVLGLRKPHNKFHGIQKCECCDRFFARFATSYFSGNCTQLPTTATQQSPCHLFLQTSTKGQPHASFGGGAAADDRPKKVIKKKIVKTKKDKTPTATIGKWTICFVPGVTDKAITVKGTVITDGERRSHRRIPFIEQFWCVLRAFSQIMRTSYLPPCSNALAETAHRRRQRGIWRVLAQGRALAGTIRGAAFCVL